MEGANDVDNSKVVLDLKPRNGDSPGKSNENAASVNAATSSSLNSIDSGTFTRRKTNQSRKPPLPAFKGDRKVANSSPTSAITSPGSVNNSLVGSVNSKARSQSTQRSKVDDRIRIVRERKMLEEQRRAEELAKLQAQSEANRELILERRRARNDSQKTRLDERLKRAEERRKALESEKRNKTDSLLKKYEERDSRHHKDGDRSRRSRFAFGSSLPRTLDYSLVMTKSDVVLLPSHKKDENSTSYTSSATAGGDNVDAAKNANMSYSVINQNVSVPHASSRFTGDLERNPTNESYKKFLASRSVSVPPKKNLEDASRRNKADKHSGKSLKSPRAKRDKPALSLADESNVPPPAYARDTASSTRRSVLHEETERRLAAMTNLSPSSSTAPRPTSISLSQKSPSSTSDRKRSARRSRTPADVSRTPAKARPSSPGSARMSSKKPPLSLPRSKPATPLASGGANGERKSSVKSLERKRKGSKSTPNTPAANKENRSIVSASKLESVEFSDENKPAPIRRKEVKLSEVEQIVVKERAEGEVVVGEAVDQVKNVEEEELVNNSDVEQADSVHEVVDAKNVCVEQCEEIVDEHVQEVQLVEQVIETKPGTSETSSSSANTSSQESSTTPDIDEPSILSTPSTLALKMNTPISSRSESPARSLADTPSRSEALIQEEFSKQRKQAQEEQARKLREQAEKAAADRQEKEAQAEREREERKKKIAAILEKTRSGGGSTPKSSPSQAPESTFNPAVSFIGDNVVAPDASAATRNDQIVNNPADITPNFDEDKKEESALSQSVSFESSQRTESSASSSQISERTASPTPLLNAVEEVEMKPSDSASKEQIIIKHGESQTGVSSDGSFNNKSEENISNSRSTPDNVPNENASCSGTELLDKVLENESINDSAKYNNTVSQSVLEQFDSMEISSGKEVEDEMSFFKLDTKLVNGNAMEAESCSGKDSVNGHNGHVNGTEKIEPVSDKTVASNTNNNTESLLTF